MANDGKSAIATKFHCVLCGGTWGDGESVGSSGICPRCFGEWAKTRKHCFGVETDSDKTHCSFYKFCREYYGSKEIHR